MNDRRDRPHLLLPGLVLLLAAAPAQASEGGLDIVPDIPILLVLIGIFALLVAPTNALLFRPIFRVLDERDKKIAGTRRHADRVAREADEVVARYERAIAGARGEVERERKQRLEVARGEGASDTTSARQAAERELEGARREMTQALAEARGILRGQAEELARDAAARLLGRAL